MILKQKRYLLKIWNSHRCWNKSIKMSFYQNVFLSQYCVFRVSGPSQVKEN